jgi:hypothetical protein
MRGSLRLLPEGAPLIIGYFYSGSGVFVMLS